MDSLERDSVKKERKKERKAFEKGRALRDKQRVILDGHKAFQQQQRGALVLSLETFKRALLPFPSSLEKAATAAAASSPPSARTAIPSSLSPSKPHSEVLEAKATSAGQA
mmetsp:Transcript_64886/g.127399  ORF Transcript_64886/g.127399 Transcript_64886/m.127399 type:complete len:110 (+) Transcript_64886:627-956(+)